MSGPALRRVALVVVVYVVVAWVVVGVAGWGRRILALPGLFEVLLRWGLALGLPLAAALAYRYPALGHGDSTAADEGEG